MKNEINVNMTPNPLDIQTLHCSQYDTGDRSEDELLRRDDYQRHD